MIEWLIGIAIVGAIASIVYSVWKEKRRLWKEGTPVTDPLIFVDAPMAVRPTILGHKIPDGYRLACLWFGTGLIDRTGTLDPGFRTQIIDRIPASSESIPDFESLCDRRARDIVGHAQRTGRTIHLYWSGGIDSTLAACALLKALGARTEQLVVLFTDESKREYPQFFKTFIKQAKVKTRKIRAIRDGFDQDALLVTGELGDQLFGSAKAIDVPWPRLRGRWQDGLMQLLESNLASKPRATTTYTYLAKQIERSPVPIADLYDALWWLNFSCKWQPVSLRMLVGHENWPIEALRARTYHFFQTEDFQRWALSNRDKSIRSNDWTTYKWPARDYIAAFTGDQTYADEKLKEPSLKGTIKRDAIGKALAVSTAGTAYWQATDDSLRQPGSVDAGDNAGDGNGFSIEYSSSRSTSGSSDSPAKFRGDAEDNLWDDLSDGE